MLSEEDQATGNMQKMVNFSRVVFEICEQTKTNRKTRLSQHFATLSGRSTLLLKYHANHVLHNAFNPLMHKVSKMVT